jgi:hypothetical protein
MGPIWRQGVSGYGLQARLIVIELILLSCGRACVGSLSDLAVAKFLACTTDSSILLPQCPPQADSDWVKL